MIAIIIAAAQRSEVYGLDEHLPLPLFPLGDRPILHHVVDFLAGQGVRRFEFVLGHLPEKIEAYLGDGARWGASFEFHLLQSTSDPLRLVETIAAGLDDAIILGSGISLPEFQPAAGAGPTLYVDDAGIWTGWALFPRGSQLFPELRLCASGERLNDDGAFSLAVVQRQLSFANVQQLLRSQNDILTGEFRGSEIGGRQTEPGIWVSRNVSLHPTVELKPPVYIGPNCKIEAGVRIGPSVVIGEGCIVDEHSSVANSLVAPGTYIGQGLELHHVIVDRNRLINTSLETSLLVSESFLLSGLARQKKPRLLRRLTSKLGAIALFLLPLPIAVLTALFLLLSGKAKFTWEQAVSIPASHAPHMWKEHRYPSLRLQESTIAGWWIYFVAEVWPGLIAVLNGNLFLVGVKPRSRQEVEKLSSDWRSLYLSSKGGLITEAFVMFGRKPNEDELYTAEAYYSAVQSVRHDLKLLRLYLTRLLTERGPAREFAEGSRPLENAAER